MRTQETTKDTLKDARRKVIGRMGEDLAVQMLEEKGYEILSRNYRCKYGEVDIIAMKRRILSFIEVKTRTTEAFGEPAEAVNTAKQRKIRLAASHFLSTTHQPFVGTEFQVVEILVRLHDGLEF